MNAQQPSIATPLIDRFGRVHQAIRISVTDRCNIRCRYCMPATDVQFMHEARYLSFEAIERFVRILLDHGLRKVRLTGGEPLMRKGLEQLVERLARLDGLDDLALTTNGMLLKGQAKRLRDAGLKRVNISLDTLNEESFQAISRRSGIASVLEGIEAAAEVGLEIRLNALVLRHLNLKDVAELVAYARTRDFPLRFIEFMPLDAEKQWTRQEMVSGDELRSHLETLFGKLRPVVGKDPSQPSSDYRFEDGQGMVGFIDSVTQPFCASCNRLRLTADGKLHNCLFGSQAWDVGEALRSGASQQAISQLLHDCVLHKHAAHGISEKGFQPPLRAMYQIGG